jgi:recombination protein RecT
MYKGFIQLALRSGQYKTINVSPIYADEFESYDIITGDINIHPVAGGYREQEDQEKIIGYVAFFRLLNGYERLEYWSMTKIIAHGQKYSKSFDNKNGLWKKDPHAMYAKTVLKNTLSKWGIMSVTMQRAMITDQAVIKSIDKPIDSDNVRYIDSTDPIKQDENADGAETGHAPVSGDRKDPNAPLAEEKTPEEPDNGKGKGFTNSPENRKTPVKPSTKDEANEGEGLFESEEAADLEEQYEREQMGPDWGDR